MIFQPLDVVRAQLAMNRPNLGGIVLAAFVNLLIGLSPGIDNWGHMGGLVGGAIFASG